MKTYRLSGAPGPALFFAPIVATVAAVVCAIFYAMAAVWVPLAGYITVIFLGMFAFGLVFTLGWVARVFKSRAPRFMLALGLWTGLVALYASWAFFVYFLLWRSDESFNASMLQVVGRPDVVWEVVVSLSEHGWFTVFGLTPSGVVLWVLWGIEALAIVAAGLIGGQAALSEMVFCERCDKWCEDDVVDLRVAPASDADVPAVSEFYDLEALTPVRATTFPHVHCSLKKCSSCDRTLAAKIEYLTAKTDDKGELEITTHFVVPLSEISLEQYERLAQLAQREPEPDDLFEGAEPAAEPATS